jgi:hypothetical protein
MLSQKEYRYLQKETGKLIIFLEQLKLKQAYHTIKHISHYICMSGVRIWTVHLFVVKVEFLTTKLFEKKNEKNIYASNISNHVDSSGLHL